MFTISNVRMLFERCCFPPSSSSLLPLHRLIQNTKLKTVAPNTFNFSRSLSHMYVDHLYMVWCPSFPLVTWNYCKVIWPLLRSNICHIDNLLLMIKAIIITHLPPPSLPLPLSLLPPSPSPSSPPPSLPPAPPLPPPSLPPPPPPSAVLCFITV